MIYHGSYRWLVLLGVEALLILWIAAAGRSELSGLAWQGVLEHWLFRSPPTPLVGRVLFGAAFAAAVWRAWPKHTPLDIGLAASLLAFFIAAEWAASPAVFGAFLSVAGAVVLVAVLVAAAIAGVINLFRHYLPAIVMDLAFPVAVTALVGPSPGPASIPAVAATSTSGSLLAGTLWLVLAALVAAVQAGAHTFNLIATSASDTPTESGAS